MYSLTHFFPVVGREMTAGGSTQIFSLCWAPLPSVHTPTSTPLFLYLTVSGSFLSLPPVQLYFPEDDLICGRVCVCMCARGCVCRKFDTFRVLHRELTSDTHTHTSPQFQSHAASLSHLCVVGTPEPGCLLLTS